MTPVMAIDSGGNMPKWLSNVLIGAAIIAGAALVTAIIIGSGGTAGFAFAAAGKAFLTASVTGLKIAAVAGATSGVIRTGRSLAKNISEGNSFQDTMVNAGKSFLAGFGDGFLAGAEYFAATTVLSIIGFVNAGSYNNGYGYPGINYMMNYQTPRVAGITLFASKIGGKFRIDMDPMHSLHYHYGKSKKARDVHRGAWIGGLVVGVFAGFSGDVY